MLRFVPLIASVAASTGILSSTDCTVVAGGIGGSSADNGLQGAWGVTVDASGSIFVADTYNHRVMRWEDGASSGTRVAGSGTASNALTGLNLPVRVLVRSDGSFLVSDYSNQRVTLWQPNGTQGTAWAENVAGPFGMALDASGNLLLAHFGTADVERYQPGQNSGTAWYGNGSQYLVDVKVGSDGLVYVLDGRYGVLRYPATQSLTAGQRVAGASLGSGPNQMSGPRGLALDSSLGLWVADEANNRVLKCPGTGAADDCEVMLTGLSSPTDIALDPWQLNFYVVEQAASRVLKCPTLLSSSSTTSSSTTSRTMTSRTTTSSSTTSRSTTSSSKTSSMTSSTTTTSSVTSSATDTMTRSSTTSSSRTRSSSTTSSSTTSSSATSSSKTSSSTTSSTTTSSTTTSSTTATTSTGSSTSTSSTTQTTTSGAATTSSTPQPTPSPGPPPSAEEAAADLLESVANVSAALLTQLTGPGVDRATVQIEGGSLTAVRLAPLDSLANSSEDGVTLEVEGPQGPLELTLPQTLFAGLDASSIAGDSLAVVVSAFSLETSASLGGQQSTQGASDASEKVVELQVLSAISIDLKYLLSGESPGVSNLDNPIIFQLPGANYSEGLRCAFWDENLLVWSYQGVSASPDLAPGQPLKCETAHLSFFAAILEVVQGFVQTWECAQLGLLSAEAVRSVFTDPFWPYSHGACVFWGVLATILVIMAVAVVVDMRRDSTHQWKDEFFLVATGVGGPDPDAAAEPEMEEEPEKEEEQAAAPGRLAAPLAWARAGTLLCAGTCLKCMWESSALREALDEIVSSWFEYWSQVRSSCESLFEVLQEGFASGTGTAAINRATVTLVMASSRRLVAASMGMTNDAVIFVLEDGDLQEFITGGPKDAAVGTRADDWRTSTDQRVAWTSLHDSIVHHLLLHTQRHTLGGLPRVVLEFLVHHNPVGGLFVSDIFHSCKKRVLLLAVDVLGAMALGCLFYDAAGMVRGKPLRSNMECDTSGRSVLWTVGRVVAIATGALIANGLPLALIESLHTKGFRKLDYRGSAAWQKQLRVWAVQDMIVWAVALLYLAFCICFIIVFLASIGPEDHEDWTTVELLALGEDFLFLPVVVALLVPGMTAALICLSARVLGIEPSRIMRQTHEALLRKTNLMLPVMRV